MITAEQIDAFDRLGAVTIDSHYTQKELDAASEAFDRLLPLRLRPDGSPAGYRMQKDDFFEPALIDVLQHPQLEEIAQRALFAQEVEYFGFAAAKTYPEPGAKFEYWEHVDIKYSSADLDARPRRMICSCLVWFTDVTPDRAPLMFRPGSHRQIAAHMQQHPDYIDDPQNFDKLPKLPYADPQPLLARRGQITVCTTAAVHGGSVCTGPLDRKVMFVTFVARGARIRANMRQVEERHAYLRELRTKLRPERRHLINLETVESACAAAQS